MNNQKAYSWFNNQFRLKPSTNGWYRMDNPFSPKRDNSMAVNFSANTVICHRTSYKESVTTFIRQYTNSEDVSFIEKYQPQNFNVAEFRQRDEKSRVKLPEHFHFITDSEPLQERAINYLLDRSFDIDLLIKRRIGFCNDGEWCGRIIVPFLNPHLIYRLSIEV